MERHSRFLWSRALALVASGATAQTATEAPLAYLDGKYRSFPNATCNSLGTRLGAAAGCVNGSQDLAGSRRAYAPKFSGNVRLTSKYP